MCVFREGLCLAWVRLTPSTAADASICAGEPARIVKRSPGGVNTDLPLKKLLFPGKVNLCQENLRAGIGPNALSSNLGDAFSSCKHAWASALWMRRGE